jgi:hypothetical protein
MLRKISLFLIVGLFILTFSAYSEQFYYSYYGDGYTPEKGLAAIDQGKHFPNEFKPLVVGICLEHPSYSKNEVASLILSAYLAIQKDKPDITMYEVAEALKRFSQDKLGIDFSTYVIAYVHSQAK